MLDATFGVWLKDSFDGIQSILSFLNKFLIDFVQIWIFELPSLKMFIIYSYYFYQLQTSCSYKICSYKEKKFRIHKQMEQKLQLLGIWNIQDTSGYKQNDKLKNKNKKPKK